MTVSGGDSDDKPVDVKTPALVKLHKEVSHSEAQTKKPPFLDNVFKYISLNESVWISPKNVSVIMYSQTSW